MKVVIFDLNRTLYDPETDTLLPGTIETLTELCQRDYKLHLISRNEVNRGDILTRFQIRKFFLTINLVERKTMDVFDQVIRVNNLDPQNLYVIGDYRWEDVRFGNQCGAHTIWLKRGAFEEHLPLIPADIPSLATIHHVIDVLEFLI